MALPTTENKKQELLDKIEGLLKRHTGGSNPAIAELMAIRRLLGQATDLNIQQVDWAERLFSLLSSEAADFTQLAFLNVEERKKQADFLKNLRACYRQAEHLFDQGPFYLALANAQLAQQAEAVLAGIQQGIAHKSIQHRFRTITALRRKVQVALDEYQAALQGEQKGVADVEKAYQKAKSEIQYLPEKERKAAMAQLESDRQLGIESVQ